jgi:putative thioredoxin
MIDFQRQVLERSREVPVVVDFWASWCGPCKTLGPVIEELAAGAAGAWELVKVSTEEQPDLAQQYGIMSIPAVKMFHAGAEIAEFVGALPKQEIERWLASHLPDPRLERLQEIVAGWEIRGVEIAADLEAFLVEHPDFPEARLRLAQAVVAQDPSRAREIVNDAQVPVDLEDLAADVGSLADLMEIPDELPPKLAPHLQGARDGLRAHDLDRTLEELVAAAMRDKEFQEQLSRRAAVALFRLLGRDHALTEEHQRRLSMALHS